MNGIYVREDEAFERAFKRFIRIAEKSGVLTELKKSQRYEKPCDKRKRKNNEAKRRALRDKRNSPDFYENRSSKK